MIVVFGSINADLFFSFRKLPRPGETVLTDGYSFCPGGKGANQAAAAARDGAEVRFVGAVGQDTNAAPCLEALHAAGVDTEHVHAVDAVTGTAVISVEESGENQILVASGANMKVSSDWLADSLLGSETTLLLQMELPQSDTEDAIRRARAKGCRVILNDAPLGPLSREALRDVDILIANEEEAMGLLGNTSGLENADLARGLAGLCRGTGIVTIGAEGVVVAHEDGCFQVPALPIHPLDTVGAGDAFCGTLAAALDRGENLPDSVCRATVASGIICTLPGAQSPVLNGARIDAALADLPSVVHI
ncbi:ribokinase [Nisaea acidiphila]|uniref:Ribokinase n=1 Tax=Nisaea acidiphila TaxID=1862145 RepID=A0A9J7AVF9_9PROT|nr:ribokinase [Nisaea acidiphila]UUX50786.1 ribokinase [Nisaea acidiphila]